jgi:hypothetical protein
VIPLTEGGACNFWMAQAARGSQYRPMCGIMVRDAVRGSSDSMHDRLELGADLGWGIVVAISD